ncbi:MAG: cold-shock protein [Azospirillaceae bacterium]
MKTSRFRAPVEPTQTEVTAVVKWFNPTKGFGFVRLEDGAPDAFLHASVLERSGHRAVSEGASLVCDIGEGQRGPQVLAIHSVTEGEGGGAAGFGGGPGADFGGGVESTLEGTVKFFNAQKGFGFILPDDGGRDVFFSAATLERAGLGALESNQRVRVAIRMGHKGPMAQSIELV